MVCTSKKSSRTADQSQPVIHKLKRLELERWAEREDWNDQTWWHYTERPDLAELVRGQPGRYYCRITDTAWFVTPNSRAFLEETKWFLSTLYTLYAAEHDPSLIGVLKKLIEHRLATQQQKRLLYYLEMNETHKETNRMFKTAKLRAMKRIRARHAARKNP